MAMFKYFFILYFLNCCIPKMSAEVVGLSVKKLKTSEQSDAVGLSQWMAKIENQEARLNKLEATINENKDRAKEKEQRIEQLEARVAFYEGVMMERDGRLAQLETKMSFYEDALMERDQRLAELEKISVERENDADRSLDANKNARTHTDNTSKGDEHMENEPSGTKRSLRKQRLVVKDTAKPKHSVRVGPAMTYEIAFCVSVQAAKVNLHVNEVVIYSDVMTDIGSGYNQHDGIYTVPESGTYVFTWTTVSDLHNHVGTSIQINGAVGGVLGSYGDSINNYQSATGVIVKSVTAGDHVYIKSIKNGMVVSDSDATTSFSGWRLF